MNRNLAMEFEADFRNVDIARAALQGIVADCFGHNTEPATDLVMAANEAMNNAVEHAGTPVVRLEVEWTANELRVFVLNRGKQFDPVAASAGLSEEEMMEREDGGYGLFLIRELVDSFTYEYRDVWNIWKLQKRIARSGAEGDLL